MRVFGPENPLDISFSPDKNLFVFVGDNGNGKTTLLDAIACQTSVFISQFPKQAIQNFTDWDVHIDNQSHLSPYLEVSSLYRVSSDEELTVVRTRKGSTKGAESNIRELKAYADRLISRLGSKDGNVDLPVIAYYDVERGQIQAPERRRDFPQTYDRWDCYTYALTPATNFKRFFAWFDLMEDEERRRREELRNFDYTSPILNAVRRAISMMMGEKYSNPRIEIHPLRFVVDEKQNGTVKRQLRMEQLSSGFKIMLAMVADLAARMAEANPAMNDPLQSSGIVLIDEIEQHLHPQWQRKVLTQLHRTFPNVQFIVTTHSPLVLLGADCNAEIFHLVNGQVIAKTSSEYSTYDVSLLLLSDLFNIDYATSPIWDQRLTERRVLLEKPKLTFEEQKRLEILDNELQPVLEGSRRSVVEDFLKRLLKSEHD